MKDMPKHNQIKYRKKGSKEKWKYGLFNRFGEDVERYWREGLCIIHDAILPKGEAHKYKDLEIVDIAYGTPKWNKEIGGFTPGDEFAEYIDNEFQKAKKKSKSAKGLVGKIFSINVADGFAYYVITRENKKTVRVEWRGFCPDRYTDQMIGWEGLVDKDRAAMMVRREEIALNLGEMKTY